jgi:hypothetical protein
MKILPLAAQTGLQIHSNAAPATTRAARFPTMEVNEAFIDGLAADSDWTRELSCKSEWSQE